MTSAAEKPEFEYDVAFSFLAQDEELALALADKLRERFRCFVFSREQEGLAGTDGEAEFNRIFGDAARLVVVLYRNGWGQTNWTRIEETAIRNRGHEEGYDFTVFVTLTDDAVLPKWVPKARLYQSFTRYGLDASAAVIESRVIESGGTPTVETAVDRAARIRRQNDAEEARSGFIDSYAGVNAAQAAFGSLAETVESLTKQIGEQDARMGFRASRKSPSSLWAISHGHTITFAWAVAYGNTAEGGTLFIRVWHGAPEAFGTSKSEELLDWEFDFDVVNGVHGFRRRDSESRFFAPPALADYMLSRFLDQVHRNH